MTQREQAKLLVENAQRLMREWKSLVEQREAQARRLEQFVAERAMVADEMMRGPEIRSTMPL